MNYSRLKHFVAILNITFLLLFGCKREDNIGMASLNIQVSEAQFNTPSDTKSAFSKMPTSSSDEIEIPWNEEYALSVKIKSSFSDSNSKIAQGSPSRYRRQQLAHNVQYRLLIFDKDHKLLASKNYVCGANNALDMRLSTTQKYSFIVYSFGESSALPDLNVDIGDSMESVLIELNSFKDAMVSSQLDKQLQSGVNNLSFVLQHTFCMIETKIITENAGLINKVGDYEVSQVFEKAKIKLNKHANNGVELQFSNPTYNFLLAPFTISPNALEASSPAQLIYADGNHLQTLRLSRLKINNIEKQNVTLLEHTFRPGVFYDIEIKIKKYTREGFEVGPLLYALGNLVFENGEYKPASNQGIFGDYWYKNSSRKYYLIPLKDQEVLNIPSKLIGGVVDDVCAQLGSGWRQPTSLEAANLKQFGSWDQQYQPGGTKAYVEGYYQTPSGPVKGVYFGTNVVPDGANQDNYLFLPYAGMYNSGWPQDKGNVGAYWHSGRNGNEGFSFQFNNNYFSPDNGGGADVGRANPIRCVKTK